MKLTTKGRYAVTAMLDLALHADQGPVALADISSRQGISLSYLEQLFSRIRKASIVTSTRGPSGGYSLNHEPDAITMADIINAVDETVDARGCAGGDFCSGSVKCLMHDVWTDLSQHVNQFLKGISLQDLMNKQSIQQLSSQRDEILLSNVIHSSHAADKIN